MKLQGPRDRGTPLSLLPSRNANFPEALIDSFDGEESHVRTCYDLLEHSVVKYPDVRGILCGIPGQPAFGVM